MKIIKSSFFVFVLILSLSCNDFLDVNTDPTRISDENLSMSVLLPTVIEATAQAQEQAGVNAQLVTHQLDRIQGGYYSDFSSNGAWVEVYLRCLNNIEVIENLSDEMNSPHYKGVAQVLSAINIGLTTDTWENAPYTDARQGSENISPSYDTQESLYNEIFTLLNNSIQNLSAAESTFSPGSDDLMFQGDLNKWIKAAYSLRARYALHLSNKSSIDYQSILDDVARGFSSNDDDLQLTYADNFTNAWYNTIARSIDQNIFVYTYGVDFMNIMNGTQYDVFDPRLPLIAELINEDEPYDGLESWVDDQVYNVLPTTATFYMDPTGPLYIMMYSELKFIEAEAALMLNDMERANQAYRDGITSHMQKLGVAQEDMDAYLQSSSVQQFDMEHLMKEKMIATVFNLESWNDMRRLGFDVSIYPAFEEPTFLDRSEPILRAEYPDSEVSRNPTNERANSKSSTTPMWKDIN